MVKPLLVKAAALAKGKALDIGAFRGVDSLFLAEKGFEVVAVEKNESFAKEIESMGVKNIKIVNRDIIDFEFEKYDLVNCSFVIHFLKGRARETLQKIQDSTNPGGVNIIIAFLEEGDFDNIHEGFFKSNELKGSYKDWDVSVYAEKEVKTKEVNAEGSPKIQKAVFLLAKKCK